MAVALSFAVQSCGSDNDNEPISNDLMGTWKLTEVSTDNGKTFSSWPFQLTTATFNENGTYSGEGYFGDGSGTWKQNGKTVTSYVDGREFFRYEIKELTSSTCTLVMSLESSGSILWIRCVKIHGGVGDGMMTITKSELEKIKSFECNDDGDMIYLKFRDGHIYTKEVTSTGFVCNEDDIIYTISGDNITMKFGSQNPSGTINKIDYANGRIGIVIDLEGTFGIATWLSKIFKQSNYDF